MHRHTHVRAHTRKYHQQLLLCVAFIPVCDLALHWDLVYFG